MSSELSHKHTLLSYIFFGRCAFGFALWCKFSCETRHIHLSVDAKLKRMELSQRCPKRSVNTQKTNKTAITTNSYYISNNNKIATDFQTVHYYWHCRRWSIFTRCKMHTKKEKKTFSNSRRSHTHT